MGLDKVCIATARRAFWKWGRAAESRGASKLERGTPPTRGFSGPVTSPSSRLQYEPDARQKLFLLDSPPSVAA